MLGPVTLSGVTANLRILKNGAEITGLDATLLGGHVHGSGTLSTAGPSGSKPAYMLTGQFDKLSPAAVGQSIGLRCSGGTMDGSGQLDLAGFTDKDLAASAKGNLHFDWRKGAVAPFESAASRPSNSPHADGTVLVGPAQLGKFDRWIADAEIANGSITLKENKVKRGSRESSIAAFVTLGNPPRVTFSPHATVVDDGKQSSK